MGYDLCVIAVVEDPIRHSLVLSPRQVSIMVSIISVGAIAGSLYGGPLADKNGRRLAIAISDVTILGGALSMGLAPNFAVLIFGRILIGVGVGIGFAVVSNYISEVSPPSKRGTLVLCLELSQCLGCLLAYLLALVAGVEKDKWRYLLIGASVAALVQMAGLLFLPESPRWHAQKGNVYPAVKTLEKIGINENTVLNELASILKDVHGSDKAKQILRTAMIAGEIPQKFCNCFLSHEPISMKQQRSRATFGRSSTTQISTQIASFPITSPRVIPTSDALNNAQNIHDKKKKSASTHNEDDRASQDDEGTFGLQSPSNALSRASTANIPPNHEDDCEHSYLAKRCELSLVEIESILREIFSVSESVPSQTVSPLVSSSKIRSKEESGTRHVDTASENGALLVTSPRILHEIPHPPPSSSSSSVHERHADNSTFTKKPALDDHAHQMHEEYLPSESLALHSPRAASPRALKQTMETANEEDRNEELDEEQEEVTTWSNLFSAKYRRSLFVALGCAVGQNLTVANAVLYFSVQIMKAADIENVYVTGVGVAFAKLVGTLVSSQIVDKIGRRLLLTIGNVGMLIGHLMFALSFSITTSPVDDGNSSGAPPTSDDANADPSSVLKYPSLVQASMMLFMFSWNLSWAGLMFVVSSEVLPSNVRSKGMSLVVALFWALAFVGNLTFSDGVEGIGYSSVFLVYAGTTLLSLLFVIFYVPETKGMSLEEIAANIK